MNNSVIIDAMEKGYQVVVPEFVKNRLRIEVYYYNKLISKPEEVLNKNKVIFLGWEDANELERNTWKKFLL